MGTCNNSGQKYKGTKEASGEFSSLSEKETHRPPWPFFLCMLCWSVTFGIACPLEHEAQCLACIVRYIYIQLKN